MSKVLGLGVVTYDYTVLLDRFPAPDQKIRTSNWHVGGGGNCANTLVALSRLGVETEIISATGCDAVGRLIREGLAEEEILTSNLYMVEENSGVSFIMVDKSENTRTIIHRPGPSYSTELPFVDEVVEGASMVYLDGRFGRSALRLARLSAGKRVPVIFGMERAEHYSEGIVECADTVITSRNFHSEYFKSNDYATNLSKIVGKGASAAIVTLGKEGCLLLSGERLKKFASYPSKALDTTGAGDAFAGGYIFGRMSDWGMDMAVDFASYIAARKCERYGAREGLPHLRDIQHSSFGRDG